MNIIFPGFLTNDQVSFPVTEFLPGVHLIRPFLNTAFQNTLILLILR